MHAVLATILNSAYLLSVRVTFKMIFYTKGSAGGEEVFSTPMPMTGEGGPTTWGTGGTGETGGTGWTWGPTTGWGDGPLM